MTLSGGSRSLGVIPERTMSRTMRCAINIAAFGGRLFIMIHTIY
jgi:hypothetical protein